MVDVTVLPPEEAPPQLTARYVISSLGEHWTAFLAANNRFEPQLEDRKISPEG